jgi:Phytanoyl-CoA dioxygenase (PhyH)
MSSVVASPSTARDSISGTSLDEIVKKLDSDGFVLIPRFLSPEQIASLKEVLSNTHRINSNELSPVYVHDAVFFSNAAAYSKTTFDILTSPAVRQLAEAYLGKNIRLKCHRVYSTWRYYKFPWHTDNKVDANKTPVKGLAFIIYLIDTDNGATQFAPGSHKVSHQYTASNFTDAFIQKTWGNKLTVAAGKAGDLVLADIRTVHRGSYWIGRPRKRVSLWFEIDANSDETERLVINPAFLPPHPSQELLDFLGVGRPGGTLRVHPADTSSLTSFPLHALTGMFFQSVAALAYYPLKIVRLRLSEGFKVKLRKLVGLGNEWN